MKQVTRYESDDGMLFDTEEVCKRHEHKQQVIKKIREGIDSACIAEDVFEFVVNNIELFCVPAGTVNHVSGLGRTFTTDTNFDVAIGTRVFVNVFEKPVPSAVPMITQDNLMTAIIEMSKKFGIGSVKKLYKEFGVNSFTEVESHRYYQMFNAVTEELKKSLPTTPLP